MEVDRRTFMKGSIVATVAFALKRGGQAAIRYFWRDPRFKPSLRGLIKPNSVR